MLKKETTSGENLSSEDVQKSIYNLLLTNKVFAKCPNCQAYMCLFEVTNAHCNKCGNIDQDKIELICFDEK